MQPVQPYNPGRYPPGPQWAQFGDDLLGHSASAADEARQKLANKRQGMMEFHIGRLERHGFAPMQPIAAQVPAARPDPLEQSVAAFDRPSRPSFLPNEGPEFHDLPESEATVSPPASPRALDMLDPLARVARAGFQVAGNAGLQAATVFKNNVVATGELAKSGAKVAGQVASVVGGASMRALSASASQAREAASSALEPGSNTRRTLASAASKTASAASSAAGAVKTAAEVAGPPIIYGAYAAAAAAGQGLGQAAAAAADVTQNVAKGGFKFAAQALEKATLSAADIINALSEIQKEEGFSAYNALENGRREALEYGPQRTRVSTPPRKRNAKTPATPARQNVRSYQSTQEWLEFSHNRGVLVEELYKRPNWRSFITVAREKDDLRKKLLRMSATDLADILVKLDNM